MVDAAVGAIHPDRVGNTAAASAARELSLDLAAVFAGSQLRVSLPPTGEEDGSRTVYYGELVRATTVLTLPAVPTLLPAPGHAAGSDGRVASLPLAEAELGKLPSLLRVFLSGIQITLRGHHSTARQTVSELLYERHWRGTMHGNDFTLDNAADPAYSSGPSEIRSPLVGPGQEEGVFYDEAGGHWRLQWLTDVAAAYPRSKPRQGKYQLSAEARLRIAAAELAERAVTSSPQAPFCYSIADNRLFTHAADPHMLDVDLLQHYADGVFLPDETPQMRHEKIASRLSLLPLASIAPGSLGSAVQAPWSLSQGLAARLQRAKELEAAATAMDADITLASSATPSGSRGMDSGDIGASSQRPRRNSIPGQAADGSGANRVGNVASAIAEGVVIFLRRAQVTSDILPTVSVRMRTLSVPPIITHSDSKSETLPMRSLLLSVELENMGIQCPFIVQSLGIRIGESSQENTFGNGVDVLMPVAKPIGTGGEGGQGAADLFPVVLNPREQHNVLYSVTLDGLCEGDAHMLSELTNWVPRRPVNVSLLGRPTRELGAGQEAPLCTCESRWNGTLDLSVLQLEWRRRLFASSVVLHSAGRDPKQNQSQATRKVAGQKNMAASQLQASKRLPPRPSELPDTFQLPAPSHSDPGAMAAPVEPPSYLDQARERAREAVAGPKPSLPRRGATTYAFSWEREDRQRAAFDPHDVTTLSHTLLVNLELRTGHQRVDAPGAPTSSVPAQGNEELCLSLSQQNALCIRISLFNVSPQPTSLLVSWEGHSREEKPPSSGPFDGVEGTLTNLCFAYSQSSEQLLVQPECRCFPSGAAGSGPHGVRFSAFWTAVTDRHSTIHSSAARVVDLWVYAVAEGVYPVGHVCVKEERTGSSCILQDIGTVVVHK